MQSAAERKKRVLWWGMIFFGGLCQKFIGEFFETFEWRENRPLVVDKTDP